MAWRGILAWTTGRLVTAQDMNYYVSDNMAETFPAKATAAGQIAYATGPNAISVLGLGTQGLVLRAGATAPEWGQVGAAGIADQGVTNAKLAADVARANLLTNGGFEIWQRGTGPFTASGAYTADRWQIALGTSSSLSVSRDGTNHDSPVGQYCLAATYTHSNPSYLVQKVENFEQLRGKTVAFSVRVKTSVANAIRARIWDGVNVTYSAYHNGNGAYQTLTVTHTVPSNAAILDMTLQMVASGTFYVDNAMLVVGSVPANYVPLHPAEEWERCQRYYEVHGGAAGNSHPMQVLYVANVDSYGVAISFLTRKAVVPTMTKNGTWNVINCGQPTVEAQTVTGYWIAAISAGTGRMVFKPDSADDTIVAEANP